MKEEDMNWRVWRQKDFSQHYVVKSVKTFLQQELNCFLTNTSASSSYSYFNYTVYLI